MVLMLYSPEDDSIGVPHETRRTFQLHHPDSSHPRRNVPRSVCSILDDDDHVELAGWMEVDVSRMLDVFNYPS